MKPYHGWNQTGVRFTVQCKIGKGGGDSFSVNFANDHSILLSDDIVVSLIGQKTITIII